MADQPSFTWHDLLSPESLSAVANEHTEIGPSSTTHSYEPAPDFVLDPEMVPITFHPYESADSVISMTPTIYSSEGVGGSSSSMTASSSINVTRPEQLRRFEQAAQAVAGSLGDLPVDISEEMFVHLFPSWASLLRRIKEISISLFYFSDNICWPPDALSNASVMLVLTSYGHSAIEVVLTVDSATRNRQSARHDNALRYTGSIARWAADAIIGHVGTVKRRARLSMLTYGILPTSTPEANMAVDDFQISNMNYLHFQRPVGSEVVRIPYMNTAILQTMQRAFYDAPDSIARCMHKHFTRFPALVPLLPTIKWDQCVSLSVFCTSAIAVRHCLTEWKFGVACATKWNRADALRFVGMRLFLCPESDRRQSDFVARMCSQSGKMWYDALQGELMRHARDGWPDDNESVSGSDISDRD